MCVAMPGRVTQIVDAARRIGRVEVFGVPRLVNLAMLEDIAPGDWVLVQVGFAVEKLDEASARETMRLLEELEHQFEQDVAATGEGGQS
jgi:hydrogenase expression/formation protein HypC